MPDRVIGARVRYLRKLQGLTQSQLADHAGVGVMCVSDLERGATTPRLATLEAIATALNTTADWLIRDGDDTPPNSSDDSSGSAA